MARSVGARKVTFIVSAKTSSMILSASLVSFFCDVNSDHTCGECVHWLGDVTSKGKRHEKFGSCFYRIGRIGAWWPTCCPQFVKNVADISSYDFIEEYVLQQTGKNDSSPECREARMAARELWRQKYE